MKLTDVLEHAWLAIVAHRLRSLLTMLGIVIGIASVILLTSVGEGARHFIMGEFTQFGTNIMAINPGRVETTGLPGALGGTIHKLSLEQCEAILRLPGVTHVVPLVFGMAEVESAGRGRSVFVYGVNHAIPDVWKFRVRQGRFLPETDLERASSVVVLGPKLKRELFAERNALGEHVRIGGQRFRVIGVMAPKGQLLGFDVDDSAYIPVASAMRLFNSAELHEIDVMFSPNVPSEAIADRVRRLLIERHRGEEDFTITTQKEMLDVLDRVLAMVSVAVGAIGAISLVVGAIGILTIMWISVNERTPEIGLSKALGASPRALLASFLVEASMLSLVGGLLGVVTGLGIAALIHVLVPGLPLHTSSGYVLAAVGVSLAVGLLSGVLPARRAARLDPIEALRAD